MIESTSKVPAIFFYHFRLPPKLEKISLALRKTFMLRQYTVCFGIPPIFQIYDLYKYLNEAPPGF